MTPSLLLCYYALSPPTMIAAFAPHSISFAGSSSTDSHHLHGRHLPNVGGHSRPVFIGTALQSRQNSNADDGKENYLSLADEAWNQFFRRQPPSLNNDELTDTAADDGQQKRRSDGDQKRDDYVAAALNAWENARSATSLSDAAADASNDEASTNMDVNGAAADKKSSDKQANGNASTKLKLSNPFMDAASSLFQVWGQMNLAGGSIENTTARASGSSETTSLPDDESIPYGLRKSVQYNRVKSVWDNVENKSSSLITGGETIAAAAADQEKGAEQPFFTSDKPSSSEGIDNVKLKSSEDTSTDVVTGTSKSNELQQSPPRLKGTTKNINAQTDESNSLLTTKNKSVKGRIDKSKLIGAARESLLTGKMNYRGSGVVNIKGSESIAVDTPSNAPNGSQAKEAILPNVKDSVSNKKQVFPARSFLDSLKSKTVVGSQPNGDGGSSSRSSRNGDNFNDESIASNASVLYDNSPRIDSTSNSQDGGNLYGKSIALNGSVLSDNSSRMDSTKGTIIKGVAPSKSEAITSTQPLGTSKAVSFLKSPGTNQLSIVKGTEPSVNVAKSSISPTDALTNPLKGGTFRGSNKESFAKGLKGDNLESTASVGKSITVATPLLKGNVQKIAPMNKQSTDGGNNTFLSSLKAPNAANSRKEKSLGAGDGKSTAIEDTSSGTASLKKSALQTTLLKKQSAVGNTFPTSLKAPNVPSVKKQLPNAVTADGFARKGVDSSSDNVVAGAGKGQMMNSFAKKAVGTSSAMSGAPPMAREVEPISEAVDSFVNGVQSKSVDAPPTAQLRKETTPVEVDETEDDSSGEDIRSAIGDGMVESKTSIGVGGLKVSPADALSSMKGVSQQTTKSPPVLKGSVSALKAKTSLSVSEAKMKQSTVGLIEDDDSLTFSDGQVGAGANDALSRPPSTTTLKGSLFKAKTAFSTNGIKTKVGGLSEKKSLVANQSVGIALKAGLGLGLKGSDPSVKAKFGFPKIKTGQTAPRIKAPSLTSDGGAPVDNAATKRISFGGIKMAPKQSSIHKSTFLKGAVGTESTFGVNEMSKVEAESPPALKSLGLKRAFYLGASSSESPSYSPDMDSGVTVDTEDEAKFEVGSDESSVDESTQNQYDVADYAAEDESFDMNEDTAASSSESYSVEQDRSSDFASEIDVEKLLENIDESSLPLLHIGVRIQSNRAGPTHKGYLILSKDGQVLPCTVKRPWTVSEIRQNAIEERQQAVEDWEMQVTTKTLVNYFEVEYHCYQKIEEVKQLRILRRRQAEAEREKNGQAKTNVDAAADNFDIFEVAVPKMLGIYQDDGSCESNDEDVWGQSVGKQREWMVYSGGGIDGIETTLSSILAKNQVGSHHLHGLQTAMNLPHQFRFGDVMDAVTRSLIENLVFLTSCNIVHRNINLNNLNCDYGNQRLQLINFGGAVDLDPKEGKRIGLETPPSNDYIPGSIANSLAEDSCATAILICQLLFNLLDEISVSDFQQQIKASSYDLDAWLKTQIENAGREFNPEDIPALEYLGERRGMWGLLKRMVQPNPMKRKLAVESLKEVKEILGLRDGSVKWTDDFIVKVATEEAYLETLIDRFGISDEEKNAIASPSLGLESDDEQDDRAAQQFIPSQSIASSAYEARPPSRPKTDVYYDITRSKLTSKYPLQKPSALSSLLPRVKSASPPATATEIAAQESTKAYVLRAHQTDNVYDITRASLGAANPYSTVLPMKTDRQLPKGAARLDADPSILYDAISRDVTPSFAAPTATYRASPEKAEEIRRWLLSYLPRLQSQDLQLYTQNLISDGFDSNEMLKTLDDTDLGFMKKGHKRVLTRKLEVERKLDFELDPSSRKRIEMLVGASSKKISEIKKESTLSSSTTASATANILKDNTLVQSLPKKMHYIDSPTQLAYSVFEAEEELEEAKEWIAERNKLAEKKEARSALAKASATEETTKTEASIEQNQLIEKRQLERSASQSTIGTDETKSDNDITETGKELQRIEAWIDEQNKLIQKRQEVKIASTADTDNQVPPAKPSKTASPSEYNIIKAGKELEKIRAWIDEQNKLVEQRQALRSNSEPHVGTVTKVDPEVASSSLNATTAVAANASSPHDSGSGSTCDIVKATEETAKTEKRIEEQNRPVEKELTDNRVPPTKPSKTASPSEYDIIKAGKEVEKIRAWIDEQNKLVEQRQALRSKPEPNVGTASQVDPEEAPSSLNTTTAVAANDSTYDVVKATEETAKTEASIEQNRPEEKRQLERSASQSFIGTDETKSDYDIIETGKELQRIEAWIDEQNKLIQKRQEVKIASTADTDNQVPPAKPSETASPSEYDIIKAGKELEKIRAWIDEQNKLVEQRQALRSAPEPNAGTDTQVDPEGPSSSL